MNKDRRKTFIVVEGDHERDVLFSFILKCFPEIDLTMDNITIYGSSIYSLYNGIVKEYQADWDQNGSSIDIPYIISSIKGIEPKMRAKDYANIILVFDYERQDTNFSQSNIEKLQKHFDNITDEGILYINYPMIESYMDMESIPDDTYFGKKISSAIKRGHEYKNPVRDRSALLRIINAYGSIDAMLSVRVPALELNARTRVINRMLGAKAESDINTVVQNELDSLNVTEDDACYLMNYIPSRVRHIPLSDNSSYYETIREKMIRVIRDNLIKAWCVEQNKSFDKDGFDLYRMYITLDMLNLLKRQGQLSCDRSNGSIWVICTVLFFMCEYKVFWKLVNDET